jgi:hypothetical protein
MSFDWDAFLGRLRAYPPEFHRVLPPCSAERIEAVEKELGRLPQTLKEMLKHLNGAELFIVGLPYLSLFGISTIPLLPPFEWSTGWYIDTFTPKWRATGSGRQNDWAIAMTNYGGLILVDGDETVKEWDTGESRWLCERLPFHKWIEKVMSEGDVTTAE